MNKRVLITRKILPLGIEILKENGFEVILNQYDRPMTETELNREAKSVSAIITMLNDKIDEPFLNNNKHLKVISNYAVGFNNINIQKASELKIKIGNTPDVLTDATAELALGLILATYRNLYSANQDIYLGKWQDWNPTGHLGFGLKNKTIGIIGLGRIGTRLAHILKNSFNMEVLYYSKSKKHNSHFKPVELSELLSQSDIVSLHLSLNEDTKNFITKTKLQLMKPSSILINTGRGELINQEDLIWALKNKIIYGAGLDVMTPEPLPLNSELLTLKNVYLLPHIGSATYEARNEMSRIAALNIINGLSNKDLIGFVNKDSLCI